MGIRIDSALPHTPCRRHIWKLPYADLPSGHHKSLDTQMLLEGCSLASPGVAASQLVVGKVTDHSLPLRFGRDTERGSPFPLSWLLSFMTHFTLSVRLRKKGLCPPLVVVRVALPPSLLCIMHDHDRLGPFSEMKSNFLVLIGLIF